MVLWFCMAFCSPVSSWAESSSIAFEFTGAGAGDGEGAGAGAGAGEGAGDSARDSERDSGMPIGRLFFSNLNISSMRACASLVYRNKVSGTINSSGEILPWVLAVIVEGF